MSHLVQNTVREGTTRADGEQVALQPRTVRVDVEQRGSLACKLTFVSDKDESTHCLVPAADHGALQPISSADHRRFSSRALTMLNPMPLYSYTMFDRILLAAATDILSLLRSSCSRHCMPRYVSLHLGKQWLKSKMDAMTHQYWQSAAPPAIVPNR